MDAANLLETVRANNETELSRLGSSKWVYALTGGEMDAEHAIAAAADEAFLTARTLDAWAADEDDDAAAELFDAVAATATDHYDTLVDADYEPADSMPLYAHLDGVEGTVARTGALVGRTLVTQKTLGQLVGFFVGDADPKRADLFRGLRDDVEGQLDEALDLLTAVCADTEGWETAQSAASAAIDAAYDDYVTTLESMGIKPKNVC